MNGSPKVTQQMGGRTRAGTQVSLPQESVPLSHRKRVWKTKKEGGRHEGGQGSVLNCKVVDSGSSIRSALVARVSRSPTWASVSPAV